MSPVIATAIAWTASVAHAGGLVVVGGSPRAIGRAGTGTVGDDGGGALLVNPAAIARRDGARAQVGVAFTDDEIAWHGARSAPVARNQAASTLAPHLALVGGLGRWVVGAAVTTAAIADRTFRRPGSLPAGALGNAFEYRYAGLGGSLRRDTATVGAARRIGDTLAVGVAVSVSHVGASEIRRVWAGFGGRDPIGAPDHDVELALDGDDWFVPGAVVGVLVAPEDSPIELGASVGWSQRARIHGDVTALGTDEGPTVRLAAAAAALHVEEPWTVRAGARYLGARYAVELGGDLWLAPDDSARATWALTGVTVRDPSSVSAPLARLPSRVSLRTHGAIRGAVDAELIGGFLWATAGYAYTVGSVDGARQSPSFGDLGGHTAAVGLEAAAGGVTVTLGWARTWSAAQHEDSRLRLDNPFAAGDGPVPTGSYDGSIDQIGVLVDLEFAPPAP